MAYNINVTLLPENVDVYIAADANNPTTIEANGTATLNFTADGTYYTLYKSSTTGVSVVGATLDSWTCVSPYKTGTLVISNPTDNVEIIITGRAGIKPTPLSTVFQVSAKAPIDTRLVLTKAQMSAMAATKQPDVYFCICKDDGKLYVWSTAFTPSAETSYYKSYEEIINITNAINNALESPATKEALEDAISETIPGALKEALETQPDQNTGLVVDEDGNIRVALNDEHLQVVDNRIDLAFSVIQAIDGNV